MNKLLKYIGNNQKNPIVVSSGPFSNCVKSIGKSFEAGVSVVTTKTITKTGFNNTLISKFDKYIINSDGYSEKSVEDWIEILKIYSDKKIITSIFGNSIEEFKELVEELNEYTSCFELCLSCPTSCNSEPISHSPRLLKKYIKAVKGLTDKPVIVKILPTFSPIVNRRIKLALEESEVDGVVISDSIPVLQSNKHNYRRGGMTGAIIKPIVMEFIKQFNDLKIPIIASGGVMTKEDVDDYKSIGATFVSVCSMIYYHKYSGLKKMIEDYERIHSNEF